MKQTRIAIIGTVLFVLLVLFQNCAGNGFQVMSLEGGTIDSASQEPGDMNNDDTPQPQPSPTVSPSPSPTVTPVPTATPTPTVTPSPTATPTPTVTPMPTVTPTPTPQPTPTQPDVKRTHFYFGGGKTITALELDHRTGEFRERTSASFSGGGVGWLTYEPTTQSVFVADTGGSTLQVFGHNASSGQLTSKTSLTTAASQVHLTIVSAADHFKLFGSSYSRAEVSYYKANRNLTSLSRQQVIAQGAGAKTHSSSYDAKRGLLYVAALGLNKVVVYRVSETGLSNIAELNLEGARTVVYDPSFDKLYVATEIYTGPSYIRIYSINSTNNSYSFTAEGSLAMPKHGGDLKINHKFNYVMATAREAGKESIWALPINSRGAADISRQSFSIIVDQALPRALEITADGLYAVVGMNSSGSEGIIAYKLNFDGNKNFISSQKIFRKSSPSSNGYLGGVSIPLY